MKIAFTLVCAQLPLLIHPFLSPVGMMVRLEEDTRKLEVAEDGRSIGYYEESEDGGRVFHPLILWGFKLVSYVSSELGPRFRGLQVRVQTNSGKIFMIEWRHKDLLSFKKCHVLQIAE